MKKLLYILSILLILFLAGGIYFHYETKLDPPVPSDLSVLGLKRAEPEKGIYTIGDNWIKQNDKGLWEMYVAGKPFERGAINGMLSKELVQNQEHYFVAQIKKIIPSDFYLRFLKYFIAWFNRDLDQYIDEEYKLEIYGVSQSAAEGYDFIGNNYERLLNYHAAHDIGHALQDKNMVVGCTSFSAWGGRTDDSTLIVGRNFDFYVGDDFAKDKIISFISPDSGYNLMTVTWGGMIGAVSGMNEKGLTLTINAAKSEIPTGAATPISIVSREILQYAKNIQEAYDIAKSRKTFVSESIMIGSLEDNRTAIIEKTPSTTELFMQPEQDHIICSNHYQGNDLKDNEANVKQQNESSSGYRYERMTELLGEYPSISVLDAAAILRDQNGLKDQHIGWGNEKAINQLIAHHSIIFKPAEKLVWVSVGPYQLGEYIAYDMDEVFGDLPGLRENRTVYRADLTIPADSFLLNGGYARFVRFKELRKRVEALTDEDNRGTLNPDEINEYIAANPDYYLTYSTLGNYFARLNNTSAATHFLEMALSKEVATLAERREIEEKLQELKAAAE